MTPSPYADVPPAAYRAVALALAHSYGAAKATRILAGDDGTANADVMAWRMLGRRGIDGGHER